MLLTCLFLLAFDSPGLKVVERISVPEPIYRIDALAYDQDFFYAVDMRECAVVKFDKDGKTHAVRHGKGQSPGQFQMPRAITVTEDLVIVGDIYKLHIFDKKNLEFIRVEHIVNNPRDLAFRDNQLFISISPYPTQTYGIMIYNLNHGATLELEPVRQIFKHGRTDNLIMPLIELDAKGNVFVQPRVGFGVSVFDPSYNTPRALKMAQPVNYRDFIPFEPFVKKHGNNFAAYKHWRTHWSEPDGLAVEDDRYVWYSYHELDQDLLTDHYFVTIFDQVTEETVYSWQKSKGKLLIGGDKVYFGEEVETEAGDYGIEIVAYEWEGK